MKFILSLVISGVICYLTQSYLPIWWLFAIVTFIIALIIKLKTGWLHFFAGFIPVMLVWMILFITADRPNDSLLSKKIAAMFSMPNQYLLFLVASMIMGIIGGLTAVAGGSVRKKNK